MCFEIRQCEITDGEAIYQLNFSEMGYEYPAEKTIENLKKILKSDKDKVFVATIGNKVVGYVHATDYDVIYAPHMIKNMGIAVFSDVKKKGIGRALLTAAEDWAKERNARGVRLVSGVTRTHAHEFYRHCGYDGGKQQVKFMKSFY